MKRAYFPAENLKSEIKTHILRWKISLPDFENGVFHRKILKSEKNCEFSTGKWS
jgi:hypothetical protein